MNANTVLIWAICIAIVAITGVAVLGATTEAIEPMQAYEPAPYPWPPEFRTILLLGGALIMGAGAMMAVVAIFSWHNQRHGRGEED